MYLKSFPEIGPEHNFFFFFSPRSSNQNKIFHSLNMAQTQSNNGSRFQDKEKPMEVRRSNITAAKGSLPHQVQSINVRRG